MTAAILPFPQRGRFIPKLMPQSAKHARDLALLERIEEGPEKEVFRGIVAELARIEAGRARQ